MKDSSPLVGLAVGDALGMPFETAHFLDDRLLGWDGTYQPSAFHKLRPGQYTDDTMMSHLLAESLIERQGLDAVDVAARYVTWYRSGDRRGMGRSTEEALRRLASGADWSLAGVLGAEGNGTAMRAGVIGAFYQRDVSAAAEFARVEATITHRSSEAEEGSAAIATAVALLCAGAHEGLLRRVRALLRPSKVRDGLDQVQQMITDRVELKSVLGITMPTGAHVTQTVPAAFACFLMTNTYMDTITTAIRAGGDTDTLAAMAGGMAGAHYGHESIPEGYRNGLEAHDTLRSVERALVSTCRLGTQ